jgi:hypothetical protein
MNVVTRDKPVYQDDEKAGTTSGQGFLLMKVFRMSRLTMGLVMPL